jgi:HflK protein
VAALLHQVSSLTVVLNSLRLLVDLRPWYARLHRGRHALEHHGRWAAAAAGLVILAAYALSGLHAVRLGEVAVVQRFGRIAGPPEPPGLHYRLPYPFGLDYRVRPEEVRRVEIGFRNSPGTSAEPPAYEWNVQHREGRYERQAEEAVVWAGDENLIDVNFVVHYRVADPLLALFHVGPAQPDGQNKWDLLVRDVAEAALRGEMARRPIDDLLGAERGRIAELVRQQIVAMLQPYRSGLAIAEVCLEDIHPPLEVVPAFRDVASATEEKEAKIHEAEAYQFETLAMGEAQAEEKRLAAVGFGEDRTQRATGSASRFEALARAYALSPVVTRLRLYLQTIDETLAGRRKVILDRPAPGSRRLLYLGKKDLWKALPPAADTAPEKLEAKGNQGP